MYELRKRLLTALEEEYRPEYVNDGPDQRVKHVQRTAIESGFYEKQYDEASGAHLMNDGDVVLEITDGQRATNKKRTSPKVNCEVVGNTDDGGKVLDLTDGQKMGDSDGDVVLDITDGQRATKKKRTSPRTGRPKCMSSRKYSSSAVTTGPGQSINAGKASTSTPNSPLQSPPPCVGAWLAAKYYQQPSSSGNDQPTGGVPQAVNNAPLTHEM